MTDVKLPEVGSEWVVKRASDRVTVLPPDMDNPLGPQVVLRFDGGYIFACSVDGFYEWFEPAPPPMPTVADVWSVVTRGGAVVAVLTDEGAADEYARRVGPGFFVARHPCAEVREPRPAEEASDG